MCRQWIFGLISCYIWFKFAICQFFIASCNRKLPNNKCFPFLLRTLYLLSHHRNLVHCQMAGSIEGCTGTTWNYCGPSHGESWDCNRLQYDVILRKRAASFLSSHPEWDIFNMLRISNTPRNKMNSSHFHFRMPACRWGIIGEIHNIRRHEGRVAHDLYHVYVYQMAIPENLVFHRRRATFSTHCLFFSGFKIFQDGVFQCLFHWYGDFSKEFS